MTYHEYKNPCRCGGKKGFLSSKCKECGKMKEESINKKVKEIVEKYSRYVKTFSENGWTCKKCNYSYKSTGCPREPYDRKYDYGDVDARIFMDVTGSELCPNFKATQLTQNTYRKMTLSWGLITTYIPAS